MNKHFMVEVPHVNDKEACLKALDEAKAQGPEYLSKFSWGCMSGNHTGYAMFDAESESEVKNLIPKSLRDKAKVMPVDKFTPDQIASMHLI